MGYVYAPTTFTRNQLSNSSLGLVDGPKGFKVGRFKPFQNQLIIQRCQRHPQENVNSYLPRTQERWYRRQMQRA